MKRNKRRTQLRCSINNGDSNSMCLLSKENETKKQVTLCVRSCVAKRKRNGRVVRLISIESNGNREGGLTSSRMASVPILPRNQYTTNLRRRAVRKLKIGADEMNRKLSCLDDEYGDISLGIKLIVVGGRVIVQSLNSLEDGLASPAQLVGVIQRGDVLLAIGRLSIINLPVDQLMEGLRPLSTPDPQGYYQRFLHLRFEAGVGQGLLKIHEEEHAKSRNNAALQEPVTEAMFSLFPVVDQLSDDGYIEEGKKKFPCDDVLVIERQASDENINGISNFLDALISSTLAKERYVDRERYESDFFYGKEDFSELLRRSVSMARDDTNDQGKRLTKSQMLELGKKIMEMAKVLELNMEEMDKGRDQRSFKNLSTSLSVRSGASSRRRYGTDIKMSSIHPGYDKPLGSATDEDSIDSGGSLEGIHTDKLLPGLAARDGIWRKEVIDLLNNAANEVESFGEEKTENSIPQHGSIDLTQQLGNFLFGEAMPRSSKQENKSFSFPPQEITRILFDLTTYIVTNSRDEICTFCASSKLSSNISSFQSGATRTGVGGRAAVRADLLLAKRFILDEALPQWLKAFRPLSLEHRKLLWPRLSNRTDSLSGTYTGTVNRSEYTGKSSDGDSLTIESGGSRTQISIAQSRKKDLRDLVDYHQVMDDESQSETCFLVTYFFTQELINNDLDEAIFSVSRNSFVGIYGAYLQIQTCLSFAALMQDEVAISLILNVARNDPNHRDALKELQKSNDLLFYDHGKLSALVQSLDEIRYESKGERRKMIRDLCVSAYPDIQPWQVRKACLCPRNSNEMRESCSNTVMEEMYYVYLCHLLNPLDGHEAARQINELVKEFCELSVGIKPRRNKNSTRMKNFTNIVARSSIYHKRYRRDLMMLLDLSLTIGEEDLALDLVDEILGNDKLSSNKDALHHVLCCLRRISIMSLVASSYTSKEAKGFQTLRQVLKLFEKMASNDSLICRKSIIVADELFNLFQQWKIRTKSNGDDPKMFLLIDFVNEESSRPVDAIRALILWSSSNEFGNSLLPRLEDILCRGIHFSTLDGELSGTLLRLKQARRTFEELTSTSVEQQEKKMKSSTTRGIWERMSTGNVSIDK